MAVFGDGHNEEGGNHVVEKIKIVDMQENVSKILISWSPGGTTQRSPPFQRWVASFEDSQPHRGGTNGSPCVAPTGLGFLSLHVPTAHAVGYGLSSPTGLA